MSLITNIFDDIKQNVSYDKFQRTLYFELAITMFNYFYYPKYIASFEGQNKNSVRIHGDGPWNNARLVTSFRKRYTDSNVFYIPIELTDDDVKKPDNLVGEMSFSDWFNVPTSKWALVQEHIDSILHRRHRFSMFGQDNYLITKRNNPGYIPNVNFNPYTHDNTIFDKAFDMFTYETLF